MRYIVILMFVTISCFSRAQTTQRIQKIGHADWSYIFNHMPEYKQIESALKTFEVQLQNQLKLKNQELEIKYKDYISLPQDVPEPIRHDKESELSHLQEHIQKFQQEAQAAMRKKQDDLIAPILEKIGKAIEAVARENGFAYIMNPQMLEGEDVLLFADEEYNISDLVLRKLGVEVVK